MSYELKCRVHTCNKKAIYIGTRGELFCGVCAVKAENVKYGGPDAPLKRLDRHEAKLMQAMMFAIENNIDDPEAICCEVKSSLVLYFTNKNQPTIAEAVKRTITYMG